ncbi:MAG: hypothetical protein IK082_03315 [Oscillospiraceae bacterium]|nr:hypothetical protein [Oscillospiraceae bacterium]
MLLYTRVFAVEEIAVYTGRNPCAVKVSLYRTRKKLRDYMKKEGTDI